jgi:hypothetical protein
MARRFEAEKREMLNIVSLLVFARRLKGSVPPPE